MSLSYRADHAVRVIISRQEFLNYSGQQPEGVFFLHENEHHAGDEVHALTVPCDRATNHGSKKENSNIFTEITRPTDFFIMHGKGSQYSPQDRLSLSSMTEVIMLWKRPIYVFFYVVLHFILKLGLRAY